MNNKKLSNKSMILIAVCTICAVTLILVYPAASAKGISDGMKYSAEMLIPSLFPFMVISSFLIRSGASDIIGRIISPVTKNVFGLPEASGAAIVMSFIGGFPVGAKCVRLLYDEGRINESQAEHMMLFCVCSGPGFLVTGVGEILLHNTALGWILYLSQLCSGIIIGIASGVVFRPCDKQAYCEIRSVRRRERLSDSFIESCSDGANSVLLLTAMVMVFTMILRLFSQSGITGSSERLLALMGAGYPFSEAVFPIVFEVTGACRSIAQSGSPLWLLSFAAGFGGLCVHFQIFAVLGSLKIRKRRYFFFRIINAFLSSVIVYIVCRFYCPADEVFSVSGGGKTEFTSVSLTGSFALIIMCAVFVLSIRCRSFSSRWYHFGSRPVRKHFRSMIF